jgi:Fungal potassium channel
MQDPQMIYKISPTASKWIYVGCIALSFLLLALDIRKARLVIASRDISYALTSITAYRYYSIKSYPHYCLFDKIQASKKTTDDFAFFVFFTLKGWKRLLFAEGPRQVVAIITVETILYNVWTTNGMHSPLCWS